MRINTVTVLGANGIMGLNISAIFASFGNAKVYMVSRDIEKSKKAIKFAAKSVRAESIMSRLIPADYAMAGKCIAESDLVFESTAENFSIKLEITKTIGQFAKPETIICSGTSGLSIVELSKALPQNLRKNYYGVHMFNPPYNMNLCELIATEESDKTVTAKLRQYLEEKLLRTVVEVKDSPAFLANRIGFQFINEALIYAEKYKDNGGIDYIDAILGTFTGRAMAPLTTADFVGLDVHKAIVDNVRNNTDCLYKDTFVLPQFVEKLIKENKLGRKTKEGLYKVQLEDDGKKTIMVYDICTGEFREKMKYVFSFAESMKAYIKNGDYVDAFKVLINNKSQEATICLHFLLNYIIYSLLITKKIGSNIHACDDVMATGFNWCPPLAMIDAISLVVDVKSLIENTQKGILPEQISIDDLFLNVECSKYDYRPYFKSGK